MVQSMTGYGAFSTAGENFKVTVELRSLNSKFIEINLKLPRHYIEKEVGLRNLLTRRLKRGKVSAVLSIEVLNPERHSIRLNTKLIEAYANELNTVAKEVGLPGVSFEYLLNLPNALEESPENIDPEEWQMIEISFDRAMEDLKDSRQNEGHALEQDMRIRSDLIMQNLEQIEEMLPSRKENIRTRLLQTLSDLKDSINTDPNRFEQELIYYIEKIDIHEETVRLRKHIKYFLETLNEQEEHGKKLGFIAQEMGREINTIGSKANDADIQVFVVRMKEELEKIKEQILNVL